MSGVVVVTGGRNFDDEDLIGESFISFESRVDGGPRGQRDCGLTLYHGNARGADLLAAKVARELGWSVIAVPVEEDVDGTWPGAGPRRNIRMLELALPDVVMAFPDKGSKGTWHCIRQAWKRGIPVWIPGPGPPTLQDAA